MTGLDTNVLVRYIAQDDPVQSAKATTLIESFLEDDPGFISVVSLTELVWVLKGPYSASKDDIAAILDRLLCVKTLQVENTALVLQALRVYKSGNADFADCLIERSGHNAGCEYTSTFDRKAANTANMQLIL